MAPERLQNATGRSHSTQLFKRSVGGTRGQTRKRTCPTSCRINTATDERSIDKEVLIHVCTGRRLFDLPLHGLRGSRRFPAGPRVILGATRTVQPTPRPARDGPGEPTGAQEGSKGRPRGRQEPPGEPPEAQKPCQNHAKTVVFIGFRENSLSAAKTRPRHPKGGPRSR